jgi:hypothetical protein
LIFWIKIDSAWVLINMVANASLDQAFDSDSMDFDNVFPLMLKKLLNSSDCNVLKSVNLFPFL